MMSPAEHKLFVGAGHIPQIEKPDEFVHIISEFQN
jgi:pimeloyl-ACP methyl ester carboxylesterase